MATASLFPSALAVAGWPAALLGFRAWTASLSPPPRSPFLPDQLSPESFFRLFCVASQLVNVFLLELFHFTADHDRIYSLLAGVLARGVASLLCPEQHGCLGWRPRSAFR